MYRLKFFFNLKTLSPNFVLIQGPPKTKRIKCKHFSYSSGKCLCQLISLGNDQLKSQGTLVLRTFYSFYFNGPYAWLRQTSKFHHQASSARKVLCICTLFAWIFFSNLLPWDILLCKTSQLYNSKRGLVEKFAHLTWTCIRAIQVVPCYCGIW